jgi:hypothetical protein
MWEVAKVLNGLVEAGIVSNYAIFGAIAQVRYTEAVPTLDVDTLVALSDSNRIDVLSGIYSYLGSRGYQPEGEAIRVGGWPVQFIPAHDPLTQDAVETAETDDIEGSPLRVVRADYLAVLALKAGRSKDWSRIIALLESGSVNAEGIAVLAGKYGHDREWSRFKKRFLDEG